MSGIIDSTRGTRPRGRGLALAGCLFWLACAGPSRMQRPEAAYAKARALMVEGRYDDAIAEAELALALARETSGDAHPDIARCLNLAGDLHRLNGDHTLAEWYLRSSLAIREQSLGKTHLHVARSLNSLALVYAEQGLHEQAKSLYERALAIHEGARDEVRRQREEAGWLDQWRVASSEEPTGNARRALFVSLHNLSRVYTEQGRYDRAEPLYRRAFAIQGPARGGSRRGAFTPLDALARDVAAPGACCPENGRLLRVALVLQEAAFVTAQPDVHTSISSLADLYIDRRLYADMGLRGVQGGPAGTAHPGHAGSSVRFDLFYGFLTKLNARVEMGESLASVLDLEKRDIIPMEHPRIRGRLREMGIYRPSRQREARHLYMRGIPETPGDISPRGRGRSANDDLPEN